MNEEKRKRILHTLKKIAETIGEWQDKDNDYRKMVLRAFDDLYKEIEDILTK